MKGQHPMYFISTFSTILVGFSFHSVYFSVINMMEIQTNKRSLVMSCTANATSIGIYTVASLITIFCFGYNLGNNSMKIIVMEHVWETDIISIVFALIAALHVPLIFFVGKEAMLIIVFTVGHKFKRNNAIQDEDLAFHPRPRRHSVSHPGEEHKGNSHITRTGYTDSHGRRRSHLIPNVDVALTEICLA